MTVVCCKCGDCPNINGELCGCNFVDINQLGHCSALYHFRQTRLLKMIDDSNKEKKPSWERIAWEDGEE
jgi:hypothetical protein